MNSGVPARFCTWKKVIFSQNVYVLGVLVILQKMFGHPMSWREKKGSAKVNNFDGCPLPLGAHYVLRFDVHVHNVTVVQVLHLMKM